MFIFELYYVNLIYCQYKINITNEPLFSYFVSLCNLNTYMTLIVLHDVLFKIQKLTQTTNWWLSIVSDNS